MIIKIIVTPDNEYTKDLGTNYIETSHSEFIEVLESITDFKVMSSFLDNNKEYYKELLFPRPRFDYEKVIDTSESYLKLLNDDNISIKDKLATRDIYIFSPI